MRDLNFQEELPIGEAEVRAVFGAGSGKAAGCMVTEGKLVKGSGIRVMRGNNSVHVGSINSLRRVKELAKEVSSQFSTCPELANCCVYL